MSDIFIGYSRTDSVIATRLAERLRAEGWSVFMDVQTPVGRRWHREIEKELHATRAVVTLWSAQSRDSDYVLEEAEYGKREDMLFPAFIERVAFPYGFGRIQTADLVSWTGEPEHPGLAQLLESLRLHLNGAGLASSSLAKEVDGRFELTKPGQTFRDSLKIGGEGPLMVVIPAGRFLMGSPPDEPERFDDEGPQHEVRIAKPFALGVHAVTFDDYDRYCDATRQAKPEDRGWGRGNRPVINVSWTDAQAYCDWLNGQTERGYRLPSEAEWEYACRAGTTTPFSFGANITPEQVNYNGSSPYAGGKKGLYREKTVPVGSLPPNPWGLHEMHGNVWEWCQDHWHDNYQSAPTDGSAWLGGAPGERRVLRGGSWIIHGRNARSAYRYHFEPGLRNRIFGFRLAQVQS